MDSIITFCIVNNIFHHLVPLGLEVLLHQFQNLLINGRRSSPPSHQGQNFIKNILRRRFSSSKLALNFKSIPA